MKKTIPLLGLAIVLISCSEKQEILMPPLTAGEISGERLWQRISADSPYERYGEWPGHDGLRPGQSPHGAMHRVYINSSLRQALPVDGGEAPSGTIIIKENYSSAGEKDKLTVMTKVKGYSPEAGDWFWAAFSSEGEVLVEGSPRGCVSCHSGREDNDYIIIKNLNEPLWE